MNLIGRWVSDPEDKNQLYGNVTLDFKVNGELIYTIHEENKDQIMLLTYKTEDGFLITNQPSHPKVEKTRYLFTKEGKLQLIYNDYVSLYIRGSNFE